MAGFFSKYAMGAGSSLLSNAAKISSPRIGGYAARAAGAAFDFAKMSPLAQNSIVGSIGGGILGGAYGAFSDNTGVFGGALTGAALGAGFGAASIPAGNTFNLYSTLREFGRSRAAATGTSLGFLGLQSRQFIGNKYSQAVNGFRALFQ